MTNYLDTLYPETIHYLKILLAGIGAYLIASFSACGVRVGDSVFGTTGFLEIQNELEREKLKKYRPIHAPITQKEKAHLNTFLR